MTLNILLKICRLFQDFQKRQNIWEYNFFVTISSHFTSCSVLFTNSVMFTSLYSCSQSTAVSYVPRRGAPIYKWWHHTPTWSDSSVTSQVIAPNPILSLPLFTKRSHLETAEGDGLIRTKVEGFCPEGHLWSIYK